jgi:hypothetical protein
VLNPYYESDFPLLKGDGTMGKKKLSHDQKRRAKLAKKAAKSPKPVSLAYDGNKYKTDELIPLFHNTELGILQAYNASQKRITDHTVRHALENLVLQIRQGSLPPLPVTDIIQAQAGELADQELVIDFIRRKWQVLADTDFVARRDDRIGVLRTLLSSIETWSSGGKESRGYLAYIEGFLKRAGTYEIQPAEDDEFEDDAEEEESELLALGRDWYYDEDLDAAADFKQVAEQCIQEGQTDYVIEVCQQLIGECMDDKEIVATCSTLSLRAQGLLQPQNAKAVEFRP